MPLVDPYDEDRIGSTDIIIRRINPKQHVVEDANLGCKRLSTKAFSPSSGEKGGMSVDIEALIIEGGEKPKEYVKTPVFTGSVQFSAGDARELGLMIGYDPISTNPYHGEVWGVVRPNRFTKSQQRGLITVSEWYIELEGVNL